jgi:hypothetical protein
MHVKRDRWADGWFGLLDILVSDGLEPQISNLAVSLFMHRLLSGDDLRICVVCIASTVSFARLGGR